MAIPLYKLHGVHLCPVFKIPVLCFQIIVLKRCFCNFVLQVKQEYWQKNMAFDLQFITEKYSETTVLAISPKIPRLIKSQPKSWPENRCRSKATPSQC